MKKLNNKIDHNLSTKLIVILSIILSINIQINTNNSNNAFRLQTSIINGQVTNQNTQTIISNHYNNFDKNINIQNIDIFKKFNYSRIINFFNINLILIWKILISAP